MTCRTSVIERAACSIKPVRAVRAAIRSRAGRTCAPCAEWLPERHFTITRPLPVSGLACRWVRTRGSAPSTTAGHCPHAVRGARRERGLRASRRGAVGACIQQRHDDAAVGDVEIHIARRKSLPRDTPLGAFAGDYPGGLTGAKAQRCRHYQALHLEPTPAGITRVLQTLPGVE